MDTKICSKCGIEKPLIEFSKDLRSLKRGGDGYQPSCKECFKKYYRDHKEEIFIQHCEYRKTPEGKLSHAVGDAKYESTSKGKEMRAKAQKKYNKTPKASARMRKFNSTPKGKANTARQHHARKSRVKNTECTLTAKQWNKIIEMQNNCCNDCGREFSEDLPSTRDHIIPVSKGGGLTFGNVQALCLSCNARKRDKIDFGTAMSKIFVEVI